MDQGWAHGLVGPLLFGIFIAHPSPLPPPFAQHDARPLHGRLQSPRNRPIVPTVAAIHDLKSRSTKRSASLWFPLASAEASTLSILQPQVDPVKLFVCPSWDSSLSKVFFFFSFFPAYDPNQRRPWDGLPETLTSLTDGASQPRGAFPSHHARFGPFRSQAQSPVATDVSKSCTTRLWRQKQAIHAAPTRLTEFFAREGGGRDKRDLLGLFPFFCPLKV